MEEERPAKREFLNFIVRGSVAIISDIHGNLEALTVVMENIQKRNIKTVLCLGNTVGYGPDPRECLYLVKEQCLFTLCGLFEKTAFILCKGEKVDDWGSPGALWTLKYAMEEINSEKYSKKENDKLWDFLRNLPEIMEANNILYVHATPRLPTREYLLPKDTKDTIKVQEIFKQFGECRLCFGGHTHIPGAFTEDFKYYYPKNLNNQLVIDSLPGRKFINVGSVGQPRDGDNRACYVIFNGEMVEWVRLPYDYQTTIKKMTGLHFPDYLTKRLEEGR